ncbi:MAG: phenylalanine--tRNA ligase beta subunit-related protein [Planctomycetota bacterium]
MGLTISVDEHPLLAAGAFATRFARPLGESPSPESLLALLRPEADAPLTRDEEVRKEVRNLLRHGGYRPTGRGKPASEYLVRAAGEEKLGAINLAVDACNAVSLASGLPISVVDLAKAQAPYRLGIAAEGAEYVFNRSGQTIGLAGLLCLFDGEGPCANAVKDCQRTKTDEATTATLSVVWGVRGHEERLAAAVAWYRRLLSAEGAETEDVELA